MRPINVGDRVKVRNGEEWLEGVVAGSRINNVLIGSIDENPSSERRDVVKVFIDHRGIPPEIVAITALIENVKHATD